MLDSFRKLLDAPTVSSSTAGTSGSGAAPPFADGSELNSPFTAGAVQQAIGALRGGKATVGLLKLDALSMAASQLAPCLASIFNACQRVAALPRCWALCGITPIHKGGDTSDPGNYRGIAVGSLLAKLYACMLNEKLMKWTEQHQLRALRQAGFCKDHRTTDQTFVVRTLIEKAKADKQPLYSCFVDFKKAYHTVPRDLLWTKLQRIGVHGEFLQGVQALYADVPMALQFEGKERRGKEGFPFTRTRGLVAYWRGPISEDAMRLLGREQPASRGSSGGRDVRDFSEPLWG
jgi:hypothetical protein